MTWEDLERTLAMLRVPTWELDAALSELRRERWVEREGFTRSYVRARVEGADHAAALAASVEQARAVGAKPASTGGRRRIPVERLPPDEQDDEPEVETPSVSSSSPRSTSGPTAPTAGAPARSWIGVVVAFGLLAMLSAVGFLVVTSPSSPLEAPPPPADFAARAPAVDPVRRIAVVGRAGSGKSVFLARLFKHFQDEVNLNPAASWSVNVGTTDAQAYIDETTDLLRRSDWPTRSADLIVATARERGSGEGHPVHMSEASVDAPGVESSEARSVMLLIDGGRLDAPETWDLDRFLETYQAGAGHSGSPPASWLAIVITKADEFESFEAAPEQIARTCLPGVTFTKLKHCFRWVRVFAVSAVGKTVAGPDGQRVPDPHGVPVGMHEPLIWLLDGQRAHDAERAARTVERQHTADDTATESLWAKQEAVRRTRARRRWVGVAIIVAAAVAALAVLRATFG